MTNRLIDQEINLPAEYQLPFPQEIAEGPLNQEAALQKLAVKALEKLKKQIKRDDTRLKEAKSKLSSIDIFAASNFAMGLIPDNLPDVHKVEAKTPQGVAEKSEEFAAKGCVLLKMTTLPRVGNMFDYTMWFIDPTVTSVEKVKESMSNILKASAAKDIETAQRNYDVSKSLIERFHKHYVQRQKQIKTMSDLFKEAKEAEEI